MTKIPFTVFTMLALLANLVLFNWGNTMNNENRRLRDQMSRMESLTRIYCQDGTSVEDFMPKNQTTPRGDCPNDKEMPVDQYGRCILEGDQVFCFDGKDWKEIGRAPKEKP